MLGLRDVAIRKQEFLHYANTPSLRVQEQAFAVKIDPPFSADATEHLRHCRNLVATDVREAVKHWIWTFRHERPYSGGLGVPFAEISQALAELPLDEDALYLSVWTIGDIAVFCEKIITAEGFWDEYPGLLYSILTIIHAIDMSSQVRTMETGEKWATYEELMSLGATLVQTMWDHHKVLLDDGRPNADHPEWARALRRRMTQLLHILCYNARGRTAVDFDEDYRRLMVLCWYHSPDIPHTDLIFSLAFRTLPPDKSALDEHTTGSHVGEPLTSEDIAINMPAWTFTEHEIINVYGLDNFLHRISITIREPTLLDNYLRNFLQEMEKWFLHPQILRKAAASGVLASLRDAVERQALHGDPAF
ncbi:hypothetical protein PENSPDRAFT_685401 [Peniophora sp. CONT]|nr:hypothetical protein PENSPDRAFT_685401 [Peniophora sp. CONT]